MGSDSLRFPEHWGQAVPIGAQPCRLVLGCRTLPGWVRSSSTAKPNSRYFQVPWTALNDLAARVLPSSVRETPADSTRYRAGCYRVGNRIEHCGRARHGET